MESAFLKYIMLYPYRYTHGVNSFLSLVRQFVLTNRAVYLTYYYTTRPYFPYTFNSQQENRFVNVYAIIKKFQWPLRWKFWGKNVFYVLNHKTISTSEMKKIRQPICFADMTSTFTWQVTTGSMWSLINFIIKACSSVLVETMHRMGILKLAPVISSTLGA